MFDGLYQSIMCYFLPYLLFAPATFNTEDGRNVNDYKRIGVYIANSTVVVVNVYILLNTYRWDWFMCLISGISILLVFFWTGVYSSFTSAFTFYDAGAESFGSLSFWAITLLTIIVCLIPRFGAKAFQKMFMPRDIDIVREQVRQGRFDYLKNIDPGDANSVTPPPPAKTIDSASSSEISKPSHPRKLSGNITSLDDERPIYPPSFGATVTTRNPRSHNGSDGTDYTGHEMSFPPVGQVTSRASNEFDYGQQVPPYPGSAVARAAWEAQAAQTAQANAASTRPSYDRPRPSFDRLRKSMDYERSRPSFEGSRDFTSAAYLGRVESSHSGANQQKNVGLAS